MGGKRGLADRAALLVSNVACRTAPKTQNTSTMYCQPSAPPVAGFDALRRSPLPACVKQRPSVSRLEATRYSRARRRSRGAKGLRRSAPDGRRSPKFPGRHLPRRVRPEHLSAVSAWGARRVDPTVPIPGHDPGHEELTDAAVSARRSPGELPPDVYYDEWMYAGILPSGAADELTARRRRKAPS